MKKILIALVLGALFTIPCVMHAEEIEIQLMEVISMESHSGALPLDDSHQSPNVPPRPNDFRATINGNVLSITKTDTSIPSAQAIVVNIATGGVVVNQHFTTSLQDQISNSSTYVLRIETASGALVGQFIVQ